MAILGDDDIRNRRNVDQYVTFCAEVDFAVKGSKMERKAVQFLRDSLDVESVGEYHLLVNYSVSEGRRGNSLEVDVVVINRLGIFLLEIKDWYGTIEAYDDVWTVRGSEQRKNPLKSIEYKARVLHSQLFETRGPFEHMSQVSVIGMVVLTQGLHSFVSHSKDTMQRIVDLSPRLIEGLSTQRLLHRGSGSRELSNAEIQALRQALYNQHQPKESIVHNYRIIKPLALRDLCETFKAQHTQIANLQVRLKRYQLPSLEPAVMEINVHHFQRSIQAFSELGPHQHILITKDFFPDDIRYQQDVFYEITELPTGPGLDEVMSKLARQNRKMSLAHQISFLQPIGLALQHAHNHKDARHRPIPIYHRNICPETVFQMRDGTVKLGDFDFAKFGDQTISVPGQTLLAKPYTAPELLQNSSLASARSDFYALGVLWYFMARLPAEPEQFEPEEIDKLDLPADARELMKRMTAEELSERPAKVEEILEALAVYQEEE